MDIDKTSGEYVLLIVDDEINVIQSIKRLFRKEGYTILTANRASEGLEILKEHTVDLILSDQRMPGMSGIQFLSLVREQFPNVIRIVLSGYTDVDTITAAINEGNVYKFMLKPWDDMQLKQVVREALKIRALTVENEMLNLALKQKNDELMVINQNLEYEVEKRTDKIIRQSRELKMAGDIMESLPVAVVCIDSTLRIIFSNSFANILFSPDRNQMIGESLSNFFNEEVLDVVNATIDLELPQSSSLCMHNLFQYGLKSTPITIGDKVLMVILSFYELD